MDWVKKNWVVLVCGLVALLGIGAGVWAMMGFTQVQTEAKNIASIADKLDGLRQGAANLPAIDEARKYYELANRDTKQASEKAIEKNRREPLRKDVFPTIQAADSPYHFRAAYREAMRRLPAELKADKAPTGDVVDRIITRMEEKAKREANVNIAGDTLRIPKPPEVPKYEAAVPAVAAAPMDRMGGRGEDPRMSGRGEDPRMSGRGEDPRMSGRGMDPRMGSPAPVAGLPMPGLATPAQTPVKLKSREELLPEARRIATYETAKRIWTYIDDMSLEMHAIGDPAFVNAPEDVDMWGAQMYYWIEKDMVDALRRVNEQAIASQNLPEDQRWVAYLPVKHLVSLSISEYLAGATTSEDGRSSNISLLHRQGGTSSMRPGAMSATPVSFGFSSMAFTNRTRNDQYDVVHVALNLVVDSRELPKVLVELCKQNFITPLNVRYQNVDVMACRQAGYVYGSGPVISVDIICEVLFFRSIYDPMKPDKVKKILSGELVEDPTGRSGGRGR